MTRTGEWMRLCEELEDEIAELGYDPETLPADAWLTAHMSLVMAEATASNDGTFRGVRVAITSMYFFARTVIHTCGALWRDENQIGPEAARQQLMLKREAAR